MTQPPRGKDRDETVRSIPALDGVPPPPSGPLGVENRLPFGSGAELLCQTIPEIGAIPLADRKGRRVVRLISATQETDLTIELQPGVNKIGRQRNGNHIVLVSGEVSRFHAEVEVREDAILIRDLGSSNGTFINGERVEQGRLESGDRVSFSNQFNFQLQVEMAMETPDAVTMPTGGPEPMPVAPPPAPVEGEPEVPTSLEERRRALEQPAPRASRPTGRGLGGPAPSEPPRGARPLPAAGPAATPLSAATPPAASSPSPAATPSPKRTAPGALVDPASSGARARLSDRALRPTVPPVATAPAAASPPALSPALGPAPARAAAPSPASPPLPPGATGPVAASPSLPTAPMAQPQVRQGAEPLTPKDSLLDPIGPPLRDANPAELVVLERERRQLAVLYQVSKRCMSAENLAELDRLLINVLERIVSFERGFITYQLPNGDWKLVMSPKGDRWDRTMVRGLLQTALRGKAPVVVRTSATDDALGSPGPGKSDARLLLPLRSRSAPVGAIFLISGRLDSFDDQTVDFLALFADIAALAVASCSRLEGRRS